jgi:hypothetical protein
VLAASRGDRVESHGQGGARILDGDVLAVRRPVELDQRLGRSDHGGGVVAVERAAERDLRLLSIVRRLELASLPLLPLAPARLAAPLPAALRQLAHPRFTLRFRLASVAVHNGNVRRRR